MHAHTHTRAPCRVTAAGSLQPSTPILPEPVMSVKKCATPRLLSKQERVVVVVGGLFLIVQAAMIKFYQD